MKKDIPEIGDLTQGINDSDIILTHKLPEMLEKSSGLQDRMNDTSEKKTETDGEPIHLSPSKEVEDYWRGFLKNSDTLIVKYVTKLSYALGSFFSKAKNSS